MEGEFRSSRAVRELDNLNSRWAICSGRHDEKVYDGNEGDNSPFTKSFINVLKKNESNSIKVSNVADLVVEQTAANYEQLPDGRPMFGVGHDGGQYIFWQKDAIAVENGNERGTIPLASSQALNEQHVAEPETLAVLSKKSLLVTIGVLSIALISVLGFYLNRQPDPFIETSEINSADNSMLSLLDMGSNDNNLAQGVVNEDVESQADASETPVSQKNSASQTVTVRKSAVPLIADIDNATIELFEFADYKGRKLKLYGDQFGSIDNLSKIDIEELNFEDVISSGIFTIPKGYNFTMYEKRKFNGQSINIIGTGKSQKFPSLGNLHDQISSYKLTKTN